MNRNFDSDFRWSKSFDPEITRVVRQIVTAQLCVHASSQAQDKHEATDFVVTRTRIGRVASRTYKLKEYVGPHRHDISIRKSRHYDNGLVLSGVEHHKLFVLGHVDLAVFSWASAVPGELSAVVALDANIWRALYWSGKVHARPRPTESQGGQSQLADWYEITNPWMQTAIVWASPGLLDPYRLDAYRGCDCLFCAAGVERHLLRVRREILDVVRGARPLSLTIKQVCATRTYKGLPSNYGLARPLAEWYRDVRVAEKRVGGEQWINRQIECLCCEGLLRISRNGLVVPTRTGL